jgi:MFS family permease
VSRPKSSDPVGTTNPAERPRIGRSLAPLLAGYWTFGQYWGVWVVVFADYLRAHHLSEGEAGFQFAALSIVSIATMTLAAPRLQSLPLSTTIPMALATMGAGALLVAYTQGLWLITAFVALGVGNGMIDVFLNVAAQGMEMRSRRPALQFLHASYSVGGITGAIGAGIASAAGVSFRSMLAVTALLLFVAAAWNARSSHIRSQPRSARAETKTSVSVFLRSRLLVLPALVVLFAFLVEGSMDVWSVIYLRKTLEASALAGGFAFASFSLSMAIGRLSAGRLLFGLGYRRTIRVSGFGALLAGLIAAATSSTVVAGIAFLFLGFFIAAAAPAAFGLVGQTDADPALAIAAMTTVGYSGFVVGPPIMGWLAQTSGLRATMAVLVVMCLGVAMGGIFGKKHHEQRPGG